MAHHYKVSTMARFYILVTPELSTASREQHKDWEYCEADGLNHAILIAELARFKRYGKGDAVNVHVWKNDKPERIFP